MNMKKRILTIVIMLIVAGIIVVADQITKFYAAQLTIGQKHPVIEGFFYITYCRNTGAAWSMFTGKVSALAIISLLASLLVIFLLVFSRYKLMSLSLGFILGGAVGNLIDRFALGYVNDFLDFYIFTYDFPVFNVADSFVVIGAMCMVLALLLSGKNKLFEFPWDRKKLTAAEPSSEPEQEKNEQ